VSVNARLVPHRRALGPALVCLLALAGCGGGDSDGSGGSSTPSPPRARQPLAAEIRPFDAALASGDCRRQAPFMFSTIRGQGPGEEAAPGECPNRLAPAPPPADARFSRAREYGTGGIMEGAAAPGAVAALAIWALDGDGRYRYTGIYGAVRGSELGSRPLAGNDGLATANRFVAAVRADDCRKLKATLNAGGRLVKGTGGFGPACKTVLDGALFAPAVRRSPEAKAVELGLVHDFGFYGVAAGGEYFTIILGDHGSKPRLTVLDVLPATKVRPAPSG
jgi:hypothetical protein